MIIAIGGILLIGIIFLLYNAYHDKLVFISIKLDNIEEKINSTLIKRKELLKHAEDIIKKKLKTEKNIFEGFDELSDTNDIIKLDRKLLVYIGEFHLIKDKYDKLSDDEEFQKVSFTIEETEDLLNAYKNYYNDNATNYNKLIRKFPVIFTTIIKRRKEKEFFDNKSINDNDYSDFKY